MRLPGRTGASGCMHVGVRLAALGGPCTNYIMNILSIRKQ